MTHQRYSFAISDLVHAMGVPSAAASLARDPVIVAALVAVFSAQQGMDTMCRIGEGQEHDPFPSRTWAHSFTLSRYHDTIMLMMSQSVVRADIAPVLREEVWGEGATGGDFFKGRLLSAELDAIMGRAVVSPPEGEWAPYGLDSVNVLHERHRQRLCSDDRSPCQQRRFEGDTHWQVSALLPG